MAGKRGSGGKGKATAAGSKQAQGGSIVPSSSTQSGDRIMEEDSSVAISSSAAAAAAPKGFFTSIVDGMPEFTERAGYAARRITASTGSAAWIVVTAGLVLALPLIIEMDREQQLIEVENQQLGVLTGGAQPSGSDSQQTL